MTILEERGLFWWHGEPIPDAQFAPDASVLGLLRIEDDGYATLVLDGRLTSEKGPMAVVSRDRSELKGKHIEGLLIASDKRVLLADLARHGGHFRTNNLCQDGYRSMHCLVGYSKFPPIRDDTLFSTLEIDLTGFEEWLRIGSIETVTADATLSIEIRQKDPDVYKFDEGQISVKYEFPRPYLDRFTDYKLSLTETAILTYAPKTPLTLEGWKQQLRSFENLFIVLTNSEYNFLWPTITLNADGKLINFEWYSFRKRSLEKSPKYYECVTNFIRLKEGFGEIVSTWMKKSERFGPGFYLYFALRRGVKFYPEHRFVNLIWGLEALHRKKYPKTAATKAEVELKAKVLRIVEQIGIPKDRRWLKNKLKTAHEPSLEQRIIDVVSDVLIKVKSKNFSAFCKRCADLRNEISHFGAQKHGVKYEDFIQEVINKSEALSVIYHMVILNEIGVEQTIINDWLYQSFDSYRLKAIFVAVGLLDESVLKPASPPAAGGQL